MRTEVKAEGISPEALKKYADFVEVHSDLQPDGTLVYNPEKALLGLLSILTPDPKGIVLAAMEDGVIYSNSAQLYNDTLSFLERSWIPKTLFPVGQNATWGYCVRMDNGEKLEGSLVKIGAVIREVISHDDLETFGYMRSEAGRDLGIPLVNQAIEFVNKARESYFPHKYDSMWRLLGNVGSLNSRRRPWTVYNIIEYLVKNPGVYQREDLVEELRVKNITPFLLSDSLNFLGVTGVINYSSPQIEVDGKKIKGWAKYKLSDPERLKDLDKLYQEIRVVIEDFHNPAHLKIISMHISRNPKLEFSRSELESVLKGRSKWSVGAVLIGLLELGIINRVEGGFIGGQIHTQVSANDLSRIFFDMILVPVREEALSLNPLSAKLSQKNKISTFLQNYQEERSNVGRAGGSEVRNRMLVILNRQGEMKLSHIAQKYNERSERRLKRNSLAGQLNNLILQGLVEKTRPGFYRLREDPETSSG